MHRIPILLHLKASFWLIREDEKKNKRMYLKRRNLPIIGQEPLEESSSFTS